MKAKFVLSKQKLMEQYDLIRRECDIVSYSLKTNPLVGELLSSTDCWFSVHSIEGLKRVEDKSRCLFFSQAWNSEKIGELLSLGVRRFAVDNKNDLDVLVKTLESRQEKVLIFLRMRLKERTVHTGKHFVFGLFAQEVNEIVKELKNNKNVELGIHFHRKTQNIHEWSMQYELKDSLTEETLNSIKYMNIGGGMPVKYKNSRDRLEHVFNEIRKLKEWLKEYNVQIITEPGRFLAAPCIELHAEIINVYKNNIVINCSVYNAAMDTFIANVRLEVEGELEKGEAYTIKGCTPDSVDIFRYRVFLNNPKVGDVLIFKNAGAYNFHSDFCFLEKIKNEIIN
ncbi:MAG: decarboxylase [Nanoarchaeota archaeon]|nr:decarboxylase [Nanoarchaeota archaeon]